MNNYYYEDDDWQDFTKATKKNKKKSKRHQKKQSLKDYNNMSIDEIEDNIDFWDTQEEEIF